MKYVTVLKKEPAPFPPSWFGTFETVDAFYDSLNNDPRVHSYGGSELKKDHNSGEEFYELRVRLEHDGEVDAVTLYYRETDDGL